MTSATALQLLHDTFGYQAFRGQQAEIVTAVASGHHALVLMPTGGGKSMCYQLPALLRKGLAIVVSPLIALLDDQVANLQAAAAAACGGLTCGQNQERGGGADACQYFI